MAAHQMLFKVEIVSVKSLNGSAFIDYSGTVFLPYLTRIPCSSVRSADLWMAVALPVAAVWTVGCFFLILITVAKAGSRRLTKNPGCRL